MPMHETAAGVHAAKVSVQMLMAEVQRIGKALCQMSKPLIG